MTPNLPHHIPRPEPKPIERLSRPQIAARVYVLRAAMDGLADQADRDGGAVYSCYGAMKVTLIALEARLREMDRAAGSTIAPAWHSAALASPAALDRLRAAELNRKECDRGLDATEQTELSALVRAIAIDSARALAHRGTE